MNVDWVIHSAAQLCTVQPTRAGRTRGERLGDLGLIRMARGRGRWAELWRQVYGEVRARIPRRPRN
jgi:hypothetical protein